MRTRSVWLVPRLVTPNSDCGMLVFLPLTELSADSAAATGPPA